MLVFFTQVLHIVTHILIPYCQLLCSCVWGVQMLNVCEEASDWSSGTFEGVASWGPFTHQHYLKTTHIAKGLLLCQPSLRILPAFNWNGNTLQRQKKMTDKQLVHFAAVWEAITLHSWKEVGNFCKVRAGFPWLMLIVDPSPLDSRALPLCRLKKRKHWILDISNRVIALYVHPFLFSSSNLLNGHLIWSRCWFSSNKAVYPRPPVSDPNPKFFNWPNMRL